MKKFTLIELLVVVAIIGILMSMLLPSLKSARVAAMGAVCVSNSKQISTALVSYSSSNGGYWPYGPRTAPENLGANPPGGSLAPQELLYNNIGESVDVFTCPLDQTPEDYKWWYFNKHVQFKDENQKSSYMFNTRAMWAFAKQFDRQLRYSDISNPAEWPQMSDGAIVISSNTWNRCSPANAGNYGVVDWWHNNDKVAVLFGDGHVESRSGYTLEQVSIFE